MGDRGPKPENSGQFSPKTSEKRPTPPPGIGLLARRLWKKIVASLPATHFRTGDLPLLRAYCEAEALHYQATKHIEREGAVVSRTRTETQPDGTVIETLLSTKANPWVAIQTQAAHTMSQLATKLRLCANSRVSGKEVGGQGPRSPSVRRGLLFGEDEWPPQ